MWKSALAIAVLLQFPTSAQARPSDLCSWIKAESQAYMHRTQSPGLAVGVVRNGKSVCHFALGVTEKGGKTPVTTTTDFHFASVSKSFVAIALMQLQQAGKLSIDDTVVSHLPYFRLADPRYRDITIRQVMTHMSGIPDLDGYDWDKPERDPGALERYVRSLTNVALISKPGEHFRYTNMGFEILGDVVAKASGMSFERYTQTHLFAPAGMRQSSFLFDPAKVVNYARPHVSDDHGGVQPSPVYPYNRAHAPSSTLHSNAIDMERWIAALVPPRGAPERILPGRLLASMFVPLDYDIVSAEPDLILPGASIGLTWYMLQMNGRTLVLHPGQDKGFKALLIFDPVERTGVVMMTNSDIDDPIDQASKTPNFFGFDLSKIILGKLRSPGASGPAK